MASEVTSATPKATEMARHRGEATRNTPTPASSPTQIAPRPIKVAAGVALPMRLGVMKQRSSNDESAPERRNWNNQPGKLLHEF